MANRAPPCTTYRGAGKSSTNCSEASLGPHQVDCWVGPSAHSLAPLPVLPTAQGRCHLLLGHESAPRPAPPSKPLLLCSETKRQQNPKAGGSPSPWGGGTYLWQLCSQMTTTKRAGGSLRVGVFGAGPRRRDTQGTGKVGWTRAFKGTSMAK